MDISLHPDQLGSDKTQLDSGKIVYPRGQILLGRTECSGMCQNDTFPFPLQESTGNFHCEDLVRFVEIKYTKSGVEAATMTGFSRR